MPSTTSMIPNPEKTSYFSFNVGEYDMIGDRESASLRLPLGGITILLVEDSRYVCDLMRVICRRLGARLRRAETIEQALTHLKTYRPDVAIVDFGLPDGQGENLIRKIRTYSQRPVVFGLSGDLDGQKRAHEAGADGFFGKPIPMIAVFQGEILRHLHLQEYGTSEEMHGETSAPECLGNDPIALRDDLIRALHLLSRTTRKNSRLTRYTISFIQGLARTTGDTKLISVIESASHDPVIIPKLQNMIRERLAAMRDHLGI